MRATECGRGRWTTSSGSDAHLKAREATIVGHEGLRDDGWIVLPETAPALIQQAARLEQERMRERQEFGNRS